MKKFYALFVLVLIGISGFSQGSKEEAIALEKSVIENAKYIGDPNVATYSMYKLIALEGENSTYKDSLALIYFSSRKFASCFLMAGEVLKRDPKNVQMLELKAVSLESLSALDKSMEAFAELFAVTNNNYHGYSLAKLQYSLKNYEEAYKTINKVEGLNDPGTVNVTFSINQNHTQQIELLAAIPYLKGLIEEELNKDTEAKLSYQKALKIQPEFVLAKEKFENLNGD